MIAEAETPGMRPTRWLADLLESLEMWAAAGVSNAGHDPRTTATEERYVIHDTHRSLSPQEAAARDPSARFYVGHFCQWRPGHNPLLALARVGWFPSLDVAVSHVDPRCESEAIGALPHPDVVLSFRWRR